MKEEKMTINEILETIYREDRQYFPALRVFPRSEDYPQEHPQVFNMFKMVFSLIRNDSMEFEEKRNILRSRFSEIKTELMKERIIKVVPNEDGTIIPASYKLNVEKFFEIYKLIEIHELENLRVFRMITQEINANEYPFKDYSIMRDIMDWYHHSRYFDETVEYFKENKMMIRDCDPMNVKPSELVHHPWLMDHENILTILKNSPIGYKLILYYFHQGFKIIERNVPLNNGVQAIQFPFNIFVGYIMGLINNPFSGLSILAKDGNGNGNKVIKIGEGDVLCSSYHYHNTLEIYN
jgi:hypothetical protein